MQVYKQEKTGDKLASDKSSHFADSFVKLLDELADAGDALKSKHAPVEEVKA